MLWWISDIVSLLSEFPKATFADLERAEVMFFTYGSLTSMAANFPTKRIVTGMTETSRTCGGLEVQRGLFEVWKDVDRVALLLVGIGQGTGEKSGEIGVEEFFLLRQRDGPDAVLSWTT